MNTHKGMLVVSGLLVLVALGLGGCREAYPHTFVWPATGDLGRTHGEPPEGGYYTNWDPHAVTLEVAPVEDVNPVQTQHVLIATVKDAEGKPLPNRRVEWMISKGSVGEIVEVDESGWRASRGHKVTNDYAISHTNNFRHSLSRGNDDPDDDVHLEPGQTWCVITSPIEGDTYVTAYAPGIYDWQNHKVFVVKHWYDVAWEFPPPATNPIGTTHELVTKVMKYSDSTPLAGYVVNYEIVDGPAGMLMPGNAVTASVKTDGQGLAKVTLNQAQPAEGVNTIKIDIIRPEDVQCCKPAAHIAMGHTTKTWVGPEIAIQKSAPAQALVGEQFTYSIVVSNPSDVDAVDVVVTDVLPDGIQYVSSSPRAQVDGQRLTWSRGTLAAGQRAEMTVEVKGTRTGTFENCADVRAASNLSDRACATTVISAPKLALEKECPAEVLLCDPIPYRLVVRNTGDGPASNVMMSDELPNGLVSEDGKRVLRFTAGTLEPGQAKQATFTVKAERTGTYVNRATASGDGGLSAEATCQTVVRRPELAVTKTGPELRYVGRPVTYQITVANNGDAPARQTVLVDMIPSGTNFMEASHDGQAAEGKVTWSLGTIEPGASKVVSLKLMTVQRGVVRNTATATAVCADGSAAVTTRIEGIPALLLEVIDLADPIEIGSNETYEITVTNQGSADGKNIVVVCTLPPEQEYVSATGPTQATADGQVITFAPLVELDPKAKATYRVVTKALKPGDTRFAVTMTSDLLTSPVNETESTNLYE